MSRGRTIAVTLGDPRGIGPEVTFRAAGMLLDEAPDADLAFFGPEGMELPGEFRGTVPYHGVGPWDGTEEGAGRVSVDAIRQATSAALDGEIGAVVTAPVHKPALHAAGYPV
ncbi:MAG: 4-hydroxythreonine-4-phosphate dehydrogenase PdxA, partial [Gemmatimonadota bacterium]|nr:4-hydroxythreonine-4-phosphate dehydrogenase PdxA [Gemmatimonadota bacterium]